MEIVKVFNVYNNIYTNQDSLQTIIETLESIQDKTQPITIVVHNHYIVTGINRWIDDWIKRGWCNIRHEQIANKELWLKLYYVRSQFSNIRFVQHEFEN
jgi:ribonuclease HI